MVLDFVRRPWDFDVLPTEKMHGDNISDLAAGLIGGKGFTLSADIGDGHAVLKPSHGTAPDISGKGKANPDRDDPFSGDDTGLARPTAQTRCWSESNPL